MTVNPNKRNPIVAWVTESAVWRVSSKGRVLPESFTGEPFTSAENEGSTSRWVKPGRLETKGTTTFMSRTA